MEKIEKIEQFDEILKGESNFYFLKHSLTCPISQAAFDEYKKFAEDDININLYYLAVQDARPLSNEMAERFNIKHESPQAFLFINGQPAWNASHRKITVESLKAALVENVKQA